MTLPVTVIGAYPWHETGAHDGACGNTIIALPLSPKCAFGGTDRPIYAECTRMCNSEEKPRRTAGTTISVRAYACVQEKQRERERDPKMLPPR